MRAFCSSLSSRVKYDVVLPSAVFLYPLIIANSLSFSTSSSSELDSAAAARAASLAFRRSSLLRSSSSFFALLRAFSSSSSFFFRSLSQSSNPMAGSFFDSRSTHSSSHCFFLFSLASLSSSFLRRFSSRLRRSSSSLSSYRPLPPNAFRMPSFSFRLFVSICRRTLKSSFWTALLFGSDLRASRRSARAASASPSFRWAAARRYSALTFVPSTLRALVATSRDILHLSCL
mmetsp:Transcript_37391/g.76217  ORF Transcript_37391/g.76217 Transcript_37391/m.76217 type:complete len:231 (+) Transcript_37391:700-1392(+)